MNLGKKIAEGFALDAVDSETEPTEAPAELRTGPTAVVTDDTAADAPAQPVTA